MLYVDLGSASNSCQLENRVPSSPGHNPCTELRTRGGIWAYDVNKTNQTFSPANRYATGIRNAVGIAIDGEGKLWSTQHGRDQLAENWSKLYKPEQGQNLPAEELLSIDKDADFGWPHCYFDGDQQKLVLAPEYGGDGGKAVGDCGTKTRSGGVLPRALGAGRLALLHGQPVPRAVSQRRVHRLPRFVESRTRASGRLSGGLPAALVRQSGGLRTSRSRTASPAA